MESEFYQVLNNFLFHIYTILLKKTLKLAIFWQLNTLGLLPTHPSDWVSSLAPALVWFNFHCTTISCSVNSHLYIYCSSKHSWWHVWILNLLNYVLITMQWVQCLTCYRWFILITCYMECMILIIFLWFYWKCMCGIGRNLFRLRVICGNASNVW